MSGDALPELERLAREAHADAIAEEARSLSERAAEGRFYTACIGQFKRGKSTLLNALLGVEILPTGIVPVTSVPTVVRHGDLAARVRQAGSGWIEIKPGSLAEFVSEERNPGNEKRVRAVEVFVPHPLLASELCFVDTPGLGSVFEANSAATREFVPQIDAALVVLGADPPISGEELALVAEIARDVDRLLFVLNKADRVTEEERQEAARFAQRVLSQRLGRPLEGVFHVSARERLTTGRGTFEWDAMVERLQALAEQSGGALVAGAVRRGAARLGARLQHVLAEEAAALRRPIAASERRLRALEAAAGEAERALQDLGPLFSAEERRIGDTFAARRKKFLDAAAPAAEAALVTAIRDCDARPGPALRRLAFQQAQRVARERVEPWLIESESRADEAYRSAAARFRELAQDLLARLRSAEMAVSVPFPPAIVEDEGLKAQRRFHFHELHHLASPAGLIPVARGLGDLLLPRGVAVRQIERDARSYLQHLLEANAARIENDLRQRVGESRRRLEGEICSLLAEAVDTARRAIARARGVQAQGQEAVRTALSRLGNLHSRLSVLLEEDASLLPR